MSEPKRFKINAEIIIWAPTKEDAESMLGNIVELDSDFESIDVTSITPAPKDE